MPENNLFPAERKPCATVTSAHTANFYLLVMDHREFQMSVTIVWRPCVQLTHGLSLTYNVSRLHSPCYCPLQLSFSLLSNADDRTVFPHRTGNSVGLKKHWFVCVDVIEGSFPVLPFLRRLMICWSHSLKFEHFSNHKHKSSHTDQHADFYNHEETCINTQYLAYRSLSNNI